MNAGLKKVFLTTAMLSLLSISACAASPGVLSPEYWKTQALKDLIPFWEQTIDKEYGGFFTDTEVDGKVKTTSNKYPRMNSRAVYGFCAAYMLSGDDKYLDFAAHGMQYMKDYGYDSENGGWHTSTDEMNDPDYGDKNLFDETYGNLGPVFYYIATGDKASLGLVSKTHGLMKSKAWDTGLGGYYAWVKNDWERATSNKSFNSQIDTFTAYLIYYYLATKDPGLLKDLNDLSDVVVKYMVDKKTGFVGESFSYDWEWQENDLWAGHNLKTGWALMRMYYLTGNIKYLDTAKKITAAQIKYTWDAKNGGWYFRFLNNDPKSIDDSKDWWTQEEGNLLMLNMYHSTADKTYLDKFEKSAMFWDKFFIDRKYGECYQTLSREGLVQNSTKANYYKSAYHSMEQALFSYLYLSLYVNKGEAELYFRLSADAAGEKHYVNLLEDPAVIIKSVELDGKPYADFNAAEGYMVLPQGKSMKIKITYSIKK
jgi:mannobiose 2-epimerase